MDRSERAKEVDVVVFDLDGTLIDSARDIAFCVNETLRRVDRPTIEEEIVTSFVGRGVQPLIERAMRATSQAGEAGGEATRDALRLFREIYEEHCLDHTRLYPGIPEVLAAYDAKTLAVVTNKAEKFTLKILEGLGIRERFSVILGGDSMEQKKPDPGPILHVMQTAGVSTGRGVIVGDSEIDIMAGKAAGIRTCGVLYGLRPESEIREARPDAIVASAPEILRWFV